MPAAAASGRALAAAWSELGEAGEVRGPGRAEVAVAVVSMEEVEAVAASIWQCVVVGCDDQSLCRCRSLQTSKDQLN